MANSNILLASNSPRRRELLGLTGWTFTVQPADIDETPLPGEPPADYVRRLAVGKARAAARIAPVGALILGADTTVADGGQIMGKPADVNEAKAMLTQLRGKIHWVYTAISVIDQRTGRQLSDVCATRVPMRSYNDEEMQAYAASGDPMDKAGAYSIQHAGFRPVIGLQGCFASVMGLPLCHIARAMRAFGLEPLEDVPASCQAHLQYDCPIFEAVQRGETAG